MRRTSQIVTLAHTQMKDHSTVIHLLMFTVANALGANWHKILWRWGMSLAQIENSQAPNLRYVDCCRYCVYADSDNTCDKHHILINLEMEPTICDDYIEIMEVGNE